MLQNRAIPSSISSPVSTELTTSLERTLTAERLRVIRRTLSLPDTPQSFLVFFLLLILFCGALACNLLLSTSIHESEIRLHELKATNLVIEQRSTIWMQEIATASSLDKIMERMRELGYVTAYEFRYVEQVPVPTGAVDLSIGQSAPVVGQSADLAAQP